MQVILDSSFVRPGSAPLWGGKKGEFRDWTNLTHAPCPDLALEGELRIGHVRYINIMTWLRGFQDKLLYLVVFSLRPSLFWELWGKWNYLQFWPESLGSLLEFMTYPKCFMGKRWSFTGIFLTFLLLLRFVSIHWTFWSKDFLFCTSSQLTTSDDIGLRRKCCIRKRRKYWQRKWTKSHVCRTSKTWYINV